MSGLLQLFLTFIKIGAFTIGGGYAMIPIIERDVVDKYHWLTKEQFLDLLVMAQSAPGILAVNIAILIGNKLYGKKGAVLTAIGAALPSFVIILLFALFINQFKDNEVVQKVFKAVRPAVVALIAVPVFNLAKTAKITWKTAIIPIAAALLVWLVGLSPIIIIAVTGVVGVAVAYYQHKHSKEETKQKS